MAFPFFQLEIPCQFVAGAPVSKSEMGSVSPGRGALHSWIARVGGSGGAGGAGATAEAPRVSYVSRAPVPQRWEEGEVETEEVRCGHPG